MCLDLVVNNKLSTCSFFEIYLFSFSIRVIGPHRISWRYFLLIYVLEIWEELVKVSLGISKDSCIQDVLLRFSNLGAGEMAQRLRTLIVLPEDLSSIPGNHMVAHNHL